MNIKIIIAILVSSIIILLFLLTPLSSFALQRFDLLFVLFLSGFFFCVAMLFAFLPNPKKDNNIIYIILIGYALYGILFIFKSSIIANGVRYFTLFDDAMISMRYAKNLVNGYGLVWNPGGDRVEGYTNLLWTIYMAFWHLFPISSAKIALPIQLTGLFFLLSNLWLTRRIADHVSEGNLYVTVGAVLLVACYQSINYWGLKGMETSVLGFIVLLSVWRVLCCLKDNLFDPLLFVILGIGLLVRPDVAIIYIGIALYMIIVLSDLRKKNTLYAASIFLLIQLSLTIFRLVYYHDIFPNTYYLKMTGVPELVRITRGIKVAWEFIRGMSPLLFVLPFVYGFIHIKNKKIWFLLSLVVIQLLYSIYVGGDAWEWWGHLANRYICIVMPLFFILLSLVITSLLEGFANYMRMAAPLKKCLFIILITLTVIQMHGGFGKTVLNKLLHFPIFQIEEDKNNVLLALKIKDITSPDAKIAVGWAGAPPYFSDRFSIDLLGKNDALIARQKAKGGWDGLFDPGHNKYDWRYSIGKLQPDLVLDYQELSFSKEENKDFKEHYRIFKIKKEKALLNSDSWIIYGRVKSTRIDWTKGTIIEWPKI